MSRLSEMMNEAVEYIKKIDDTTPEIGIILGTGLGSLVNEINITNKIPYKDIPHFPVSTVMSHAGEFVIGDLHGKKVVAMQGRFHYYEGYSMQEVTFPVRVMRALGAETLIVSNACGGLNPLFKQGDIMLITDQIGVLMPDNPLRGANDESIGERFPDMYDCYTSSLIELAEKVALENNLKVQKGVYVGVTGPNLETAAEYRFLRMIGADVVGMSTVPEVIVAVHMKMKVLGISCVTDLCLADALKPANIEEIIKIANETEPKLTKLVSEVVKGM